MSFMLLKLLSTVAVVILIVRIASEPLRKCSFTKKIGKQ